MDRFDPLNLAKDKETLLQFRAAEIKHARLAMLAAAGWPLAEVWDKSLANLIGADSPIADNGGLVRACVFWWFRGITTKHGKPVRVPLVPDLPTHLLRAHRS